MSPAMSDTPDTETTEPDDAPEVETEETESDDDGGNADE